jgi:bifunctional ADP-heptose synthase (sugar kinase/adenylyltransferase)
MKLNYLVIGEQCVDEFIYGTSHRLSPEAPVPVFTPDSVITNGGMAKNVMNNLKSLALRDDCNINSIFSDFKPVKKRYVDKRTNHYFLRVDDDEKNMFGRITYQEGRLNKIKKADCIIISDYNKGFLKDSDIDIICSKAKKDCVIFLDTKRTLNKQIIDAVDYLKLNESEYKANKSLIDSSKLNLKKAVITLGQSGCCYDNEIFESPKVINTIDVSGAGDTFTAALAYKYMANRNIEESIIFANEMAGKAVAGRGVTVI